LTSIAAGSDVNPQPTNPYQAADVVSGSVTATYNLPFTPSNLVIGPNGLPINPSLLLGDIGAFVTDGQSNGDSTNGLGPKIVSLNIPTGGVNWSYQIPTGSTLSLISSSTGGGLTAKSTSGGVDTPIRFDSAGNAVPDSWSATSISNDGGDAWLGYSTSGTTVSGYNAVPIELSTSAFPGSDGAGGNSSAANVSVSNYSTTGTNESTIITVLQEIATALPNNSACNNWLQGPNESGLTQIQNVLTANTFGHGTITQDNATNYKTAAFSGNLNPDHTQIPGLPLSATFFVNDLGAFFNQFKNGDSTMPFNVGKRNYPGDSQRAQLTILIHETAHQISVPGFQPDFTSNKAEKNNNKAVDKNCRSMIEGIQ
jgi:hypothetical protein